MVQTQFLSKRSANDERQAPTKRAKTCVTPINTDKIQSKAMESEFDTPTAEMLSKANQKPPVSPSPFANKMELTAAVGSPAPLKQEKQTAGPRIFYIEGNIGSGKSTLVQRLAARVPGSQAIQEPVEHWRKVVDKDNKNILDHFYKDMKAYAYTFQSFAFLSRVHALRNIDPTAKYVFVERSIFSDRNVFALNCFESGIMSDIEWRRYNEWFDWMVSDRERMDGPPLVPAGTFVYLDVDADLTHERLIKRNRSEEAGVPLDYLKDLHRKHQQWLVQGIAQDGSMKTPAPKPATTEDKKDPILVVDGTPDFENHDEILDDVICQILGEDEAALHGFKPLSK